MNTWQHEVLGKSRIELAGHVLEMFHKANDQIFQIRFIIPRAGEAAARQRQPDEGPIVQQRLDAAYIAERRLRDREPFFSELRASRIRFVTMFGEENAKPFDTIFQVVSRIRGAATDVAHHCRLLMKGGLNDAEIETCNDRITQAIDVIQLAGPDDPIASQITQSVSQMDTFYTEVISGKFKRQ